MKYLVLTGKYPLGRIMEGETEESAALEALKNGRTDDVNYNIEVYKLEDPSFFKADQSLSLRRLK